MLRNHTKKLIAHELELMLNEISLDKVRVNDLCTRCGINHQVFYYHFHDKYDVVAWIFREDLVGGHEEAGHVGYLARTTVALERMWRRRGFYRKAFSDRSQNSIESYIQEFDVAMSSSTVKKHLGTNALTSQQMFDIKHQSFGSIGCVIEWLKGELDAPASQFSEWEFERMPSFLKEAFDDADALSYG